MRVNRILTRVALCALASSIAIFSQVGTASAAEPEPGITIDLGGDVSIDVLEPDTLLAVEVGGPAVETSPGLDVGTAAEVPAADAVGDVTTDGDAIVAGPDALIDALVDTDITTGADVSLGVLEPVIGDGGDIADVDADISACIAAAILSGRPTSDCGGSTDTGLADALADVGACVRVGLLAGTVTDSCRGSASTTSDALADVTGDASVCAAIAALAPDLAATCTTFVTTIAAGAVDPGAHGSADVCLGLAVLSGLDPNACNTVTSSSVDPDAPTETVPTGSFPGSNGSNGSGVGTSGTGTDLVASPAGLGLTGSNGSGIGGTLPMTGGGMVMLALVAVALVAAGTALNLRTDARRG